MDQVQIQERERAFVDTMKAHGLFQKKLMLKIPYCQDRTGYAPHIEKFLEKQKDIDAILFATNYLGMFGIKALKEQEIVIPDGVAVMSFDDTDLFRFSSPSISVISQPVQEIASQAVGLLLDQINSPGTKRKQKGVLIPPELIIRESV